MTNIIIWFPTLLGSIFIIVGMIINNFPPKKINWLYGYRTPSSMKSQERWDYAQIVSSYAIQWAGMSVIFIGIWVYYMDLGETKSLFIDIVWMMFSLVCLLMYVERKINIKFNPNEI